MRHVALDAAGEDPGKGGEARHPATRRLRGSICFYQGEELGLTEAELRLRGSARPLWHPLLAVRSRVAMAAARRWCGSTMQKWRRLSPAANPGCRCRTRTAVTGGGSTGSRRRFRARALP